MERSSIIYCFSIIMTLFILYNLFKYLKDLKNYKKMAKEDKKELIELLKTLNITREEFGKNKILVNKFIKSRIRYHNITPEEYINYVFPYFKKYLGKENYLIEEENDNNGNNISYWREI